MTTNDGLAHVTRQGRACLYTDTTHIHTQTHMHTRSQLLMHAHRLRPSFVLLISGDLNEGSRLCCLGVGAMAGLMALQIRYDYVG